MTLTLTIANVDRLENGEPARMQLDRHGLTIGRSPHTDWSLPDPQHYISSSHCEVRYRDGAYTLVDTSTNGTYLKGSAERLPGPHVLADGDVIVIGHYELLAKLQAGAGVAGGAAAGAGAAQAAFAWGVTAPTPQAAPSAWDAPASPPTPAPPMAAPAATPASNWGAAPVASPGWGAPAASPPASAWGASASAPVADAWGSAAPSPSAPAPAVSASSWGAPSSAPLPEEAAGLSGHWAAPSVQSPAPAPSPHSASPLAVWDAPAAPVQEASAWSDPAGAAPRPAAAGDIWASMADINTVDWDRGGFDRATPKPPAALAPAPAAAGWGAPAWTEATPQAPANAPPTPHAAADEAPAAAPKAASGVGDDGGWAAFLTGAGVAPGQVKSTPAQALAAAGGALKRLVGGMVVLMEARARAKAQMGAQGTMLEFSGNNPLKFARAPEQALAQLLNPAERGFMGADLAIEDAFRDLQAHQMATLAAMQGALRATVTRFAPSSIRSRAETRGVLAKILPAARDQVMWQAYEREFEGVAKGSDEAFMDVFAKEFRQAYEQAAAKLKTPSA